MLQERHQLQAANKFPKWMALPPQLLLQRRLALLQPLVRRLHT